MFKQYLYIQMKIEEATKTSSMLNHSKTIVNLVYTANYVTDSLNEVIKPFDISLQQFNVLRILRGQKGKPANLFTIQERMINKMSNTTRLIDKLIVKGYVERIICKKNRRKVEITITDNGLEVLKLIDEKIEEVEKTIIRDFNENEIDTLNNLLDKLRT